MTRQRLFMVSGIVAAVVLAIRLQSSAVGDDPKLPPPMNEPRVGRFQIVAVPGHSYVLDTATGQVWHQLDMAGPGSNSRGFLEPKLEGLTASASTMTEPTHSGQPVSYWVRMLGDANAEYRGIAINAVAQLGPKARAAMPVLVTLLVGELSKDTLFNHSQEIRVTIIQVDPEQKWLFAQLKARDYPSRRDAALAICDREWYRQDNLKDADASQRVAPRSLIEHGIIPVLLELLQDREQIGQDPELTYQMVGVLGLALLGPDATPAVPALRTVMKNSPPRIRAHAARALGLIGDAESLPALKELLKDKDETCRVAAIEGLAGLKKQSNLVVPELIRLLKDKQDSVRLAAVESLRSLGSDAKAAVPELIRLARDPKNNLADPALRALESIAPQEAVKLKPVAPGPPGLTPPATGAPRP